MVEETYIPLKVKAAFPAFNTLRLQVLKGLKKEDFRALQAGKPVTIDGKLYEDFAAYFEPYEEKKQKQGSKKWQSMD